MFAKLFQKIKRWWYNRAPAAVAPTPEPQRPEPPAPTIPDATPEPQVPIIGNNDLWYPKAVKGSGMKMQGRYRKGHPEGAIVHFTAGRCNTEQEAKDSLAWGIDSGYTFFVIGPTGVVYQNFPLSHWGHHAGSSSWPGLGSGVSNYLVGIEVACAGKVDSNGKSWFNVTYPPERLRTVSAKDNRQAGTYVKYTPEQEKALIDLLVWLKRNNPKVFRTDLILGHDSVSPGRKNDPGGSLSMTIPELQKLIAELTQ